MKRIDSADTDSVGPVTTIVDGRLYALHNPYELNGLVSTHPTWARGFAPLNVYLLIEGNRALLLDTGFSVHERSVLTQISSLLPEGATLSIFPLTIGEYSGICNTRPVIESFDVDVVYGIAGSPAAWTDFRPEYVPYGGPVGHGALAQVGAAYLRSTDVISWSATERVLDVLPPAMQALPDNWAYDAATKTLFTGDSFNHVWRTNADGPWTVEPDETPPSFEHVYKFLTGSRFWWLPGAHTDELLRSLRSLFEEREVDVIAPRAGCIITDPDSVRAHCALLEAVLSESPRRRPPDVRAGIEPMGR